MKKKILIDLTNLSNPTCGFGQIALNYKKRFADQLHNEVEFIFLMPHNREYSLPPHIKNFKSHKIYRRLKFMLPKVDLWHSVNQQFGYLRLSGSTKHVLTVHDLNFIAEKSPASAARKLKRLQRRIDKAAVITVISDFVAQDLKKHIDLKGKEVITIYNGVERIDQCESKRPGFVTTERPFFFTIGQIRKKKNFHILVDVMKNFPEYDLYISGDDHFDYADEIRKHIRELNAGNVFLTGPIQNEEKVWLYKNCSAFLFPSTLEGFGLPVIEAMQFGKAVFSSNCTSLPEVCGDCAFIWENFDPEYMTRVIKENLNGFYDDQARIEKIKQHAFSFGYEKHIQAYLDLYLKLLK